MRLIPYVRVSTDEQADHGHSLTAQREALNAYAAAQGHLLVEGCADEGVSGGRGLTQRAGGNRMLALLERGDADGVIVTRLDRLFRDLFDGLAFFRRAVKRDWRVVSLFDAIDTSTPAGRLHLHIMLATAQYERELARERTTAVTHSLRARGRVYGTTPFGCISEGGKLYRAPSAWRIREMIVEWHNARRYSLRTIRGMLYDLRIPAPAGGLRWSTSTLRGLIETHHSLAHLPVMGAQSADLSSPATEAPVSHGNLQAFANVPRGAPIGKTDYAGADTASGGVR